MLCATIDRSGNMETKINSLVKEKGLNGRVKLVTDFLDDDVVIATLANANYLFFHIKIPTNLLQVQLEWVLHPDVPIAVSPIQSLMILMVQ